MAWVVFAAILISIPFFVSYYGINKEKEIKPETDLTVMSFNVRYFDLYNWSKNTETYPLLIEYINNSGADIVSLQEFPGGKNSAKAKDIIQKLTAYPYHIIEGHIALFSAKPIVKYEKFSFSKEHTSTGMVCDILNQEDTLRIYNIHLESYKLTEDDIKFLKDIQKGESSNLSEGIKNVSVRLTVANKNRAIQANLVKTTF
ncbi:MAG: hypothetical protein LIO65_05380 [Odoribacter sp.]|nr:hypothetical protein [Odoribacter sp.]